MIPSTDLIKDDWNKNSEYYSDKLEKGNIIQGIQMCNMLKFTDDSTILEVGCGSGHLASYLLTNLNIKCKYTSIDLSDKMIEKAEARKKTLNHISLKIEHRFAQGNAEDLSLFSDESVDVYLAPLCLHLVNDPNKALKEAIRVMKRGASFGISVLGTSKNCTELSIYVDKVKLTGFEPPARRSSFYLGDRTKLINLIQDAGLTVEYCWNSLIASSACETENYIKMMDTFWSFSRTYHLLTQDQKSKLKTLIDEEFEKMKKEKIPMQIEFNMVVGKKM